MRVIVTRPAAQAAPWVEAVRQAGWDALALPLIDIAPVAGDALVEAWQRLAAPAAYDACMLVSANAVAYFFAAKPAHLEGLQTAAAGFPRVFVTGPGSRAAVLRAQVDAALVDAPLAQAGAVAQMDSEALWRVVAHRVRPGYRVLIVRGTDAAPGADTATGVGRDWFAQQVLQSGGQVDFVVAYQRRAPVWSPSVQALAQAAACDGSVWLLSSSQAVMHLQTCMPGQSWQAARAVATHARIAQAARQAGFGVVRVSSPSIADVLASIESLA